MPLASGRGQTKGGRRCYQQPGPWHFLLAKGNAMSTITKSRRPVKATKPATGSCRWLLKPVWPKPGVLQINGTEYLVEPIRLDGFRLTKPNGTVYDLDTTVE